MSDTSIPGTHNIHNTIQGYLPVNLEEARQTERHKVKQVRLEGITDPAYLGVEHLDILGRFKDSEGNLSEFVISTLNGKWVYPNEEVYFEGISLSRVNCGEKQPITIQFHGVVTIVNNSNKPILPGQPLILKMPKLGTGNKLIDRRLVFTLEPIDVDHEILSFTRRMLNNVTENEIKFNKILNNHMEEEATILRNMVLNTLSSSIPIMSMLYQLGIISINLEPINVDNLIRDTNTNLIIDKFDEVVDIARGPINGGRLITGGANSVSKNEISEKTQALAKLFGLHSSNSDLKANKLIQFLMIRSFSEDKNIDNISDLFNSNLSTTKKNSERVLVDLLNLTTNKIKSMGVARAITHSNPGTPVTIQF